jgi:hypothetical protein
MLHIILLGSIRVGCLLCCETEISANISNEVTFANYNRHVKENLIDRADIPMGKRGMHVGYWWEARGKETTWKIKT